MKDTTRFSLCVYCGSRTGAREDYLEAAREVGRQIGQRGWQLVYGGGNVGNSGALVARAEPHHGREHSVTVTLPPLATVVLKPRAASRG